MRAITHLAATVEPAPSPRRKAPQPADDGVQQPSEAGQDGGQLKPDSYLERLVKYVPVEIVTAFTVLATVASGRDTDPLLWATLVFGLAATPLLLYGTSRQVPKERRPKFWMYVLAPIAFVIWAVYMNESVRDLAPTPIDQGWATFLLVAGVIAIPALDEVFDHWWANVRIVKTRRRAR